MRAHLEQQDPNLRIFGEARRQHATGGSGAGDDEVVPPLALAGIVRGARHERMAS
jgi:hypothetical protein